MLEITKENTLEGYHINLDIGQGFVFFVFRPNSFDYAIGVSALQCLYIEKKVSYNVIRRSKCFLFPYVNSYHSLLCVFKFYPKLEWINIITEAV